MKILVKGKSLTLRRQEFVAAGGEGSVYARKGTAYKVFASPDKAPAQSKLAELAAIGCDRVLTPREPVRDRSGAVIGYAMPFVADGVSLAQLTTRAFRQRVGFTDRDALGVVAAMRDTMLQVHAAGIVIVDLSATNVLVRRKGWTPCFIDTDSWMTPSHPPTAVTPAILDPKTHGQRFDAGSDWFAFAVLTFELLVGIHPFKGKHPTLRSLRERMDAGVSAFDPDVRLPRVCAPLDTIPQPLRDWYREVLGHRERGAPPGAFANAPASAATAPTSIGLDVERLFELDGDVRLATSCHGFLVTTTDTSVFVDGKRVGPCPPHAAAIAWAGRPVIVGWDRDGRLTLDGAATCLVADEVVGAGGRVFARREGDVFEVRVSAPGSKPVAAPRLCATAMPHASALFCGVLVQSVLGATHATLLEAGGCPQVRIAELDRRRVVDARHDGGVLVVLTSRAGRFDRWVFRFDRARRSYDHHRVRDVTPIGAVFVTTDRGTCALRSADGVQVFSAAPGPWDVRRVDLHADAGAFLQHEGSVVCVTGRAVDRLRYRPKSA